MTEWLIVVCSYNLDRSVFVKGKHLLLEYLVCLNCLWKVWRFWFFGRTVWLFYLFCCLQQLLIFILCESLVQSNIEQSKCIWLSVVVCTTTGYDCPICKFFVIGNLACLICWFGWVLSSTLLVWLLCLFHHWAVLLCSACCVKIANCCFEPEGGCVHSPVFNIRPTKGDSGSSEI